MGWRDRPPPLQRPQPVPVAPLPTAQPEAWQPGDMAECIYDGVWLASGFRGHHHGPRQGEVRKVTAVVPARLAWTGLTLTFLAFERYHGCTYQAAMFRKVTPQADQLERADDDFIAELLGPSDELERFAARWSRLAARFDGWMPKAAAALLIIAAGWVFAPAIVAGLTRVPA